MQTRMSVSFNQAWFVWTILLLLLNSSLYSLAASSRLPTSSNHHTGVLSGILTELQDALVKLKAYTSNLDSGTSDDVDEPSPEKPEKETHLDQRYDDDHYSYPELVSELERFGKDTDEPGKAVGSKNEGRRKGAEEETKSDINNNISLKDALMYLANLGKQLKKDKSERRDEPLAEKVEKDNRLEQRDDPGSDPEFNTELEVERQYKNYDYLHEKVGRPKGGVGKTEAEDKIKPVKDQSASNNEAGDSSLKEALMYLVSLGKQLKQNNGNENQRSHEHS